MTSIIKQILGEDTNSSEDSAENLCRVFFSKSCVLGRTDSDKTFNKLYSGVSGKHVNKIVAAGLGISTDMISICELDDDSGCLLWLSRWPEAWKAKFYGVDGYSYYFKTKDFNQSAFNALLDKYYEEPHYL